MRNIDWSSFSNSHPPDKHSFASDQIAVSLGDVMPVLADSFSKGLQWVNDFENDRIEIPKDLYETIQAAKKMNDAGI